MMGSFGSAGIGGPGGDLAFINQNNKLNAISKIEFNTVILKFWLDSCGNTNLGLKAYQLFGNSKISKLNPIPFNTNLKLICI